MKRPVIAVAVVSVLLLNACSSLNQRIDQPPPSTVKIAVTIYATSYASATPAPIVSATPIPTTPPLPQSTQVSSECPMPVDNVPAPSKPATFTDTVPGLISYLNAGASSTATLGVLRSWGMVYAAPGAGLEQGGLNKARLLPDRDAQLIVSYNDPADAQAATHKSELLVLRCSNRAYQLLYQASADPELAGQVTNGRVFTTQDVTGDGSDDLSYVLEDCSENTCYDGLYILKASNDVLVNVIPDFQWSPYPKFEYVPGARTDAKALDLNVRVGMIASPGSGPQRTVTQTWSYNGAVFTQTLVQLDPPVYRIHALMDADSAFRQKNLADARKLYQRVMNDGTLKSWTGNAPLRDEQQVLASFAAFRLMQVAASTGDGAGVIQAHDVLVTITPPKSPGVIYLQMAEAFMAVYKQGADYQKACDAALHYAEKNKNVFVVIGQDTFGSANYDYQAPDMCIIPQ